MKKLLVVLLILAVAGGLFAQGFTLGGVLKTGLSVKGDDVIVNHSGDDLNRLDLNGAYAAEDFGVKFGLRSDNVGGKAFTSQAIELYNAYVWVDLFGDMANVKAGKIDDGVWGSGGDVDKGFGGGSGLRLEVTPIAGLNFGAIFTAGEDAAAATQTKLADFFAGAAVGAQYDVDAFRFAVAAKGFNSDIDLLFGLNLKMVPGLTANLDGAFYDMFDEGAIAINLGYAFAANARAGVVPRYEFAGSAGGEGNFADAVKVKVYGSYDINELFTAGIELPMTVSPSFVMDIVPKLTYKVGAGATIDILDKIMGVGGNAITNQFQIDFTYAF
ncbi:MAG: hypothetical protein LBV20_03840 [Treponema sp.]|jgi:hypothetical protein|nr:hypothetical protein [Treponema sp.]